MANTKAKCVLLENYMNYLTVIKNRSHHTLEEYRVDLQLFFKYVNDLSHTPFDIEKTGYSFVDIEYIKNITLESMYGFIVYSQEERKIRQIQEQEKSYQYVSFGNI